MESLDFAVDGGTLRALRWGQGGQICVALHGITANASSWAAVAQALPSEWSLVALDQRGRGHSRDLPGPYDAGQLARDARAVVEATGARVLAGHSMGAYVAMGVEHAFPGLCERLVLVDGGLPLPVPAQADPDAVLAATLGPTLDRLRETYADEDAYVGFFRGHPAMGPYWSPAIEAYARYDAISYEGGVRSRAVEEAVRVSGRELIVRGQEIEATVRALSVPARLLCAERGMLDQPGGLLPHEVVLAAAAAQPLVDVIEVPDTNHYTILLGLAAAASVAKAIVDPAQEALPPGATAK